MVPRNDASTLRSKDPTGVRPYRVSTYLPYIWLAPEYPRCLIEKHATSKKKKENLHGRSLRLVKSRGSSVSSFENVVQVVRVLSRILVKIVEEYSNNTTIFVRNDKFANRRLSSSTRERFFPFFFVVALLSHLEPYHRMP